MAGAVRLSRLGDTACAEQGAGNCRCLPIAFRCRVEERGSGLSEVAGFDLDRNTAQAWSRFQARLADRIAEMTDQDTLVIDTEVADEDIDGAVPYVQFAGFGDGTMVRGEVSSNAYLAARYELSAEQCERMSALGWHPPTVAAGAPEGQGSANFFLDVPVSEADRLAVMSVKALREVFGVPHPAFLAAGDLAEPAEEAATTPVPAVAVDPDEPLATMPESVEHLRHLVDAALTPLFDGPPAKDDDGDIPVPYGSSLVYVRVEEDTPIINLFSTVARGVTHLDRAAFEVNVLNRDLRFLKFFLVEDRVVAQIHVPASPFVPEHLRSMLTGMSQWLDDIDEDLVGRVGGRRAFDPAEGSEDELDVDPAELDGDPAEQEKPATRRSCRARGPGCRPTSRCRRCCSSMRTRAAPSTPSSPRTSAPTTRS